MMIGAEVETVEHDQVEQEQVELAAEVDRLEAQHPQHVAEVNLYHLQKIILQKVT